MFTAAESDQENITPPVSPREPLSSSQVLPLSSPLDPLSRTNRPKRHPPVTPRRFTRFFNPRLDKAAPCELSKEAQALRESTARHNNALQSRRPATIFEKTADRRNAKRQKLISSQDQASVNFADAGSSPPSKSDTAHAESYPNPSSLSGGRDGVPPSSYYSRKIYPVRRPKKQHICADWRASVADFWTSDDDWHDYQDTTPLTETPQMPFCLTSCNTNSLLALGDELGKVRLIDSAQGAVETFQQIYLEFKPHANAIMDMTFSSDDSMLATASSDQTGRIIDMRSQQTLSILADQTSTVKRIAFQPGNDKIVATGTRSNAVSVWDLRCRSGKPQIRSTKTIPEPLVGAEKSIYSRVIASISRNSATRFRSSHKSELGTPSTPTTRNRTSATCLSFLSADRPYHLLTTTDSTAQMSLWDIRQHYRSSRLNDDILPVSITAPPSSHLKARHYGVSSLALNTDGSRIYSVCKDNTVYAYSTSQIVLGTGASATARAKSSSTSGIITPSPSGRAVTDAPGPLFGLRHPKLLISSFYIRAAVRKPSPYHGGAELLAVASSDKCAVIFPTDEKLMSTQCPHHHCAADNNLYTMRPPWELRPAREPCKKHRAQRGIHSHDSPKHKLLKAWDSTMSEEMHIYSAGAALIEGHSQEVTGIAWTHQGELATLGDDYKTCLWHEDTRHGLTDNKEPPLKRRPAALLRQWAVGYEGRHDQRLGKILSHETGRPEQRWDDMCFGWAEVGGAWDDDASRRCIRR